LICLRHRIKYFENGIIFLENHETILTPPIPGHRTVLQHADSFRSGHRSLGEQVQDRPAAVG
jgi:hypothetical protein